MKTNTVMVDNLNEHIEQQMLIEHRSFVFKNIHYNLEKITTVLEDLTNLSDKIEDYSVKHKLIIKKKNNE
jgi:hypothetical protein